MTDTLSKALEYFVEIVGGLPVALLITVVAIGIGFPIATVLAYASEAHNRIVRYVSITLVELGRGFPAIVVLYLIYQGIASVGPVLSPLSSAFITFIIGAAGYGAEIIRAGIGSIPAGQVEAAKSCGLTRFTTFRFVILPQLARLTLPPLMNLAILILQMTSIAYIASVQEVLSRAYYIGSITFQFMLVFVVAGFVYAMVTIPATRVVAILERRFSHTSL